MWQEQYCKMWAREWLGRIIRIYDYMHEYPCIYRIIQIHTYFVCIILGLWYHVISCQSVWEPPVLGLVLKRLEPQLRNIAPLGESIAISKMEISYIIPHMSFAHEPLEVRKGWLACYFQHFLLDEYGSFRAGGCDLTGIQQIDSSICAVLEMLLMRTQVNECGHIA